ncbi:MAG: peptidylprolyl isomerase [bacterium]|nr:peptidylprolyl isomerase [bacterium]
MKRRISLIALLAGFLVLVSAAGFTADDDSKKDGSMDMKPDEEIAVLQTTAGDIVLRFFPDVAPGHVKNFKDLAQKKDENGEYFYDGTKFHRVIKGFMIQGGDPNSKSDNQAAWGTGGPGYTIKAEFNDRPHKRGTLSMARTSDPNSAGSQFFICHQAAPHLDHQYTVFGEVAEGMDVVDKIATAPVGPRDVPLEPVTIKHVKIETWADYQKSKESGDSK